MDAVSATAPVERRMVQMRRILVVDDELMMLASMRRALRGEFEVETASSGSEALEKLIRTWSSPICRCRSWTAGNCSGRCALGTPAVKRC
jgi:DNA-binding NtrC family response regulator